MSENSTQVQTKPIIFNVKNIEKVKEELGNVINKNKIYNLDCIEYLKQMK